jgi:hypothetical protein
MAEPSYIALNEEQCWTLFYGDGTNPDRWPLAIGRPFEPGPGIQEAVDELAAWACDNGYEVVTPLFGGEDVPLETLIEPEIYDDVFGAEPDEQ